MKAVLIFEDIDKEQFKIELKSHNEEALRREARKEILAYTGEGCELIDYFLEGEQ